MRIASRHPERDRVLFREEEPRLQPTMADIHDDASVATAVAGAYGVVNAVSLYVERGNETFQSVHVTAAARIARQAWESGVKRPSENMKSREGQRICSSNAAAPKFGMLSTLPKRASKEIRFFAICSAMRFYTAKTRSGRAARSRPCARSFVQPTEVC